MGRVEKESIAKYGEALKRDFGAYKMSVLLCGPSYAKATPGARLRKRLEIALFAAQFDVVLGEDDGLVELQKLYKMYAHQNELAFVENRGAAVVIVADSVGAFCELGMFAHEIVNADGPNRDLVLIIDQQYRHDESYLNLGPAKVVQDLRVVYYVDFAAFDVDRVVDRLAGRRTLWIERNKSP